MEANTSDFFCIQTPNFRFFMQKSRIFGAERVILRHFQLIFRPYTYLKSLQVLSLSLLFGVRCVFPKNYDFSENCSIKSFITEFTAMVRLKTNKTTVLVI